MPVLVVGARSSLALTSRGLRGCECLRAFALRGKAALEADEAGGARF